MYFLNWRKFFVYISIFVLALPFGSAQAGPLYDPDQPEKRGTSSLPSQNEPLPTDRIIIKFKPAIGFTPNDAADLAKTMETLSQSAQTPLSYFREITGGAHVISLHEKQPYNEVQAIAQKLMERGDVEYAEPDQIRVHTLVPNDPQYTQQWHYSGAYGINLPAAWNITTGSSSVVVAVIDTGVTNHADLSGKVLAGYDFISDPSVANDGNGRDSSPSDPGDWTVLNECYSGSPAEDSSWHGTHVAGTIGANTNNSLGVAGVSWGAKILPVRVLGKCGGYDSDIADAMRWAAGLSVYGVPNNPTPAKVLNLSLGGYGPCDITYQNAVNEIIAAGSTIVVSAGNSNDYAANYSPANCNGVITVGATDIDGWITTYSNFDSTLEISAPGGDFNYDPGILSTLNTGTTVPVADTYAYYQGTSMAAPHVSGIIALMLSVAPDLTPAQVLSILQSTSKDFGQSWCNMTNNCGAGIADAAAAVKAAQFYDWSGGVSISSTQPLVTVARPHIGPEIASYNGFTAGATASYVPMLFRNAFGGTYNSALYVQNVNPTLTANIVIKYYDADGNLNCTKNDTISPRASKGYWLPSVTCTSGSLYTGWVGGATITSDLPIVTVGRQHIGSEMMTYNGAPSGGTTSYIPMLFKGAFGGTYNSAFYVQNIHTSNIANITIKYYDSAGTLQCTKNDTLSPFASKGYWVPAATCDTGSLPAGWAGGVIVTSDQPIVGVGRPHIGSQVTTYNGFTSGSSSSYLTMLFKDAFGGSYDSAFYVQNTHASSTANVIINFYDNSGVLVCTKNDTIDPRASKGYWVPSTTCNTGSIPTGWSGGVVITSSQPIVTVGRPHIGAQITTYDGATAGATSAYLPMLFKNAFGGSYNSALYLQNTGGSATVTLSFYNSNGQLSCTRTESISALSITGLWLPSLTCDP